MSIDIPWMEAWFRHFNKAYFNDRLPLPSLKLSRSRTRLGSLTYKRRRQGWRTVNADYAIHLSTYYDMEERDYQNVLLHEMIHYVIAYEGDHDSSAHGPLFRAWMRRLNAEGGWDISVSGRRKALAPKAAPRLAAPCVVLAARLRDGRCLLSRVNPRYLRHISQLLRATPDVAAHGWYVSADPLFAEMPAVRSPRGRIVSQAIYDRVVGEAHPLT